MVAGVEDDMNDNGSGSDSSTYEKIDDDMHYMVPRNIVSQNAYKGRNVLVSVPTSPI